MSGTEPELVVCDALEDRRFADNMLVAGAVILVLLALRAEPQTEEASSAETVPAGP